MAAAFIEDRCHAGIGGVVDRGRCRGAKRGQKDTLGRVGFAGSLAGDINDEPSTVAALRGLFVLNTPVSAVHVLTLLSAPISATTRGTVVYTVPGGGSQAGCLSERRGAIG